MSKYFYQQKLPHFQPPQATFFVTYRLAGSIPMEKIREWQDEYRKTVLKLITTLAGRELHLAKQSLQDAYFEKTDNFLDTNLNEPYWLKEKEVAQIVAGSLHFLAKDKIDLWCFCIMPNHVHVLLNVKNDEHDLFRIMQQHKSFTANQANKILSHSGQFWERESYDHVLREGKFWAVVSYILNNPVKAGFVKDWREWGWNYLNPLFL
jgi:putative transposase